MIPKFETTTQSGFTRKRTFFKIWNTLDNRNIQSVILDLVEELFSNPFSVRLGSLVKTKLPDFRTLGLPGPDTL